jgi:hypothetical protein
MATGAFLAAMIALPGSSAPTASESRQVSVAGDTIEAWRFNVGERLDYSISWGVARVGSASLTVEAVDTIAGLPTYRTAFEMSGGPPFYRLDDRQVSWIRPAPFASVRFDQTLRQGGYRRDRRHVMDLDSLTYDRYDLEDGAYVLHEEEFDEPIPEGAVDDVSFLYFLRLAPLEVGRRYEFERFFKEKGNPIVIEVLRRERIRTPSGRYETVVLRPTVRTGELFKQGSDAEVYVTDDDRRLPVRMRVKAPMGTLNLYLTDFDMGSPGVGINLPAG